MTTKSRQEKLAEYCVTDNLVGTKNHMSPSGKYSLTIEEYSTKGNGWNVTKGIIKEEEDKVLHEVFRNYSSFWFEWLEKHPSGKPYVLYGEDYKGYGVYNLEDKKEFVYLPDAAKKGHGWCFVAVVANPSKTTLAVNGCYWAFPYKYRFYDITDIETLPWKIIREDRTGYAHCAEKEKWLSDTKLRYQVEDFFYPYFNKKEHELTDEEFKKMEEIESAVLEKFPDVDDDDFYEYFGQYSSHVVDVNDKDFREISIIEHPEYKHIDNFVKTL